MDFKNKRKTKGKYLKWVAIISAYTTILLSMLVIPGIEFIHSEGNNLFRIRLNGEEIGCVDTEEKAEELLWKARYQVSSTRDGFTFMDPKLELTGEEMMWGYVDDEQEVLSKMVEVLGNSIQATFRQAYTVKVKEYIVNLPQLEDVEKLFQAALAKYDEEGKFKVGIVHDPGREFSVFTTKVENSEAVSDNHESENSFLPEGGALSMLLHEDENEKPQEELSFDDYEYGLMDMDLVEDVEVVKTYLPAYQINTLEEAIDHLVTEQEVPVEYTIVSGDTLSEIALKVDIPMEQIVEMNSDKLDNVNTQIHVGDKLIITVPEPELSVARRETKCYEEIYDADTVYIDNNEWYTTQSVVRQQPSAGFRKIAVEEQFVNDNVIERNILKEELVQEAVALVVERGTKIPPTYIKPISGGRISSPFGYRTAPTKGATSYHKGCDWATPTGTSVRASCGGTVVKAGWGGGYGNVIFIDHADGRQTRYAHLSKVLVKVGQTVKQGDKIALSGSTGVSTGPHVHFEILIDGKQVDPLKYVSR